MTPYAHPPSPVNALPAAVLFDLDGTLVDNFEAIHHCCLQVLEAMHLPPVSLERVRRAVGGSIEVTMQRLVGDSRAQEAVTHYRKAFARDWNYGLRPMPGASSLLAALSSRGVRSAVFTNKDGDFSRRICRELSLDSHLESVLGARDTPYIKPQPEFSLHMLASLRLSPQEACMVGDSPFDIAAARSVGLRCLTVTTGTHAAHELEQADAVYSSLPELARLEWGLSI